MPGRQSLGTEFTRGRKQVAKLDRAIALDAGHRRFAEDVAFRKAFDHGLAKPAFIIQHVMRNADAGRDIARVVNILTGAAGTLAMGRGTMIVKLQGDANDVVAFCLQQRSRRRGIDAARHGDDDPRVFRTSLKVEAVEHSSANLGCSDLEPPTTHNLE